MHIIAGRPVDCYDEQDEQIAHKEREDEWAKLIALCAAVCVVAWGVVEIVRRIWGI